ncbi:MAG: inositol monophosphatase family protein [Thermoanaerobaculia bacterium]
MIELEVAAAAARAGADVLLKYWRQLGKADADLKARNDWVSNADRESEAAIVAVLREHFPGDAILGEESGAIAVQKGTSDSGRTWVIDPLDGTSNYLQHFPVWSVSIGLRRGDEMIAGLIHEPLRDEWFTAEKGSGAFRGGERMHVSDQGQVEGAFLATGFPFRAQKFVDVYTSIFRDVISTSKGVRRAGSAALDLAYTAAGVFDGFFELHLAPWDIAAGALIVREAGGVVTDFSGGELFWERGNIVGAPAGVHRELLEMIGRYTHEANLDR